MFTEQATVPKSIETPSVSSNQREVLLKQEYMLAYNKKQYEQQCLILEKLARYHISKKDYWAAAKLFNEAYAICCKQKATSHLDSLKKNLEEQLKSIEILFVNEQLAVPYPRELNDKKYGINPEYKEQLLELRVSIHNLISNFSDLSIQGEQEELQDISKLITVEINGLLKRMVQECIELIGSPPPCEYAFVGTGSLARMEMTPYSDLEYFLLIESNLEPKHTMYFKLLTQLLEIKIIQLGETDPTKGTTLLPVGVASQVVKGFSLDVHKNATNKQHSLIGTPKELAYYQMEGQSFIHEPNNHLSCALINAVYITGSEHGNTLLEGYNQYLKEYFDTVDLKTQCSLRKSRSLFLLSGDIEHFAPKLDLKDAGRLFQVKEDFYRLPQTILDALFIFYDLKSNSTYDRIKELQSLGILSELNSEKLKKVLNLALFWRLRTYSTYDCQRELVDIVVRLGITESSKELAPHVGLTKSDIEVLTECYKILMPLYQCTYLFYLSQGSYNSFLEAPLYDDSLFTRGKIARRLCQYQQAEMYLRQALIETADQGKATSKEMLIKLSEFTNTSQTLGKTEEIAESLELGLILNAIEHGRATPDTVSLLQNLGIVYLTKGELKRAKENFELARKTYEEICKEGNSRQEAEIQNCLGEVNRALGDNDEALKHYSRAIEMTIKHLGEYHSSLTTIWNNTGLVLINQGKGPEAVKYFEKAIKVLIKEYGDKYPDLVTIYNNLGMAWRHSKNMMKAIECYNQSLALGQMLFGNGHPLVSTALNNLGVVWRQLDELHDAKCCYEEALTIDMTLYGQEHFNVARDMQNLGTTLHKLKESQKGLNYLKFALNIFIKKLGDEHPTTATTLLNIGAVYRDLGNFTEALTCFEQAYYRFLKTHGLNHPLTTACGDTLEATQLQALEEETSNLAFLPHFSQLNDGTSSTHQSNKPTEDQKASNNSSSNGKSKSNNQ